MSPSVALFIKNNLTKVDVITANLDSGIPKNYIIKVIDPTRVRLEEFPYVSSVPSFDFFKDLQERDLETTNYKLDFHESKLAFKEEVHD